MHVVIFSGNAFLVGIAIACEIATAEGISVKFYGLATCRLGAFDSI